MSVKPSKLYFDLAFNKQSQWALVSILNAAGVSADDFSLGRFSSKLLVAGMIRVWLDNKYKRQPAKLIRARAELKQALPFYRRASTPNTPWLMRAVGVEPKDLMDMCQKAAKEAELYTDENGKVASCKAWGFSYNETDHYEAELERYKYVVCPECDSKSVFNDDIEDAPLENAKDFTYLSGPYCRCESCDKVVRPVIEDADQMPDGWWDDGQDEWDDYKHSLSEIVEALRVHLQEKAGLPKPDLLYLVYGNSDWRGRTGYKSIPFDGEALAEAMTVSGGFTVSDGWLHLLPTGYGFMDCGMSHHDASGHIRIEPIWLSDLTSYHPEPDEHQMLDFAAMTGTAKQAAEAADLLLCGPGWVFTFSDGDGPFKPLSVEDLQNEVEALQERFGNEIQVDHGYGKAVDMLLEEAIKLLKQGIVPSTDFCRDLRSVLLHILKEV